MFIKEKNFICFLAKQNPFDNNYTLAVDSLDALVAFDPILVALGELESFLVGMMNKACSFGAVGHMHPFIDFLLIIHSKPSSFLPFYMYN